jgi:hypothetical protein
MFGITLAVETSSTVAGVAKGTESFRPSVVSQPSIKSKPPFFNSIPVFISPAPGMVYRKRPIVIFPTTKTLKTIVFKGFSTQPFPVSFGVTSQGISTTAAGSSTTETNLFTALPTSISFSSQTAAFFSYTLLTFTVCKIRSTWMALRRSFEGSHICNSIMAVT